CCTASEIITACSSLSTHDSRLTTHDSRLEEPMTVEAPPIEVEKVRDEERFFGGDIVWWVLLLVVSIPVILLGLSQAPTVGGFLILGVGGVLGGVAFAQVMLR